MLVFIRLLIIGVMPALLWLGWSMSPELISASNMRYLGGVFVVVWGMAFYFLRKIADLSGLTGLSGREQERLVWLLADIRRRIWWIGSIGLIAGCLVWFVGSVPDYSRTAMAPVSIGLLVGIGLSYLVILPGWFNELHAFTDSVRLREDKKRRAEAALKQISEAKKSQSSTQDRTH